MIAAFYLHRVFTTCKCPCVNLVRMQPCLLMVCSKYARPRSGCDKICNHHQERHIAACDVVGAYRTSRWMHTPQRLSGAECPYIPMPDPCLAGSMFAGHLLVGNTRLVQPSGRIAAAAAASSSCTCRVPAAQPVRVTLPPALHLDALQMPCGRRMISVQRSPSQTLPRCQGGRRGSSPPQSSCYPAASATAIGHELVLRQICQKCATQCHCYVHLPNPQSDRNDTQPDMQSEPTVTSPTRGAGALGGQAADGHVAGQLQHLQLPARRRHRLRW